MPMEATDVPKTAVTTLFGMFEFLGVPMELRNYSETFERFVDSLLRKLPFVRCYLDDLLVISRSHEEHMEHLHELFKVLREVRLSMNLEECAFTHEQVE